MLMKQRRRSAWQGCLTQHLLGAHEYLSCALHFVLCLQTEFFCLSEAFTNLGTKQTDVQSNTKNLNYSGTQAVPLNLSFSQPPPQYRGFNPVMSVSGSLLRPCCIVAASSPGSGGGRRPRPETPSGTARPGSARRRLPLPPLGRAPGLGPGAALVLRHPRAQRTKPSDHAPEQPDGMGSSQREDVPGNTAGALPPPRAPASARLQRCSRHKHNRTQHHHNTHHGITSHSKTQRRPSLPTAKTSRCTTTTTDSSRCIQKRR